jgi:hypothetical protein
MWLVDGKSLDRHERGMDLKAQTAADLLKLHAGVIEELRSRGVVRTGNNPIGDYTEWLVCKHLGLVIQPNSRASYDGIDSRGIKYQIKGRRVANPNGYAQLGVIRNLEANGFDYLIAVVFNQDYTLRFAAKIPHAAVSEIATYRSHVNGHVPIIRETIFELSGVLDITDMLSGPTQDPVPPARLTPSNSESSES